MADDTYRCAHCQGEFAKGWSDEEAEQELHDVFDVPTGECDLVCDDCFQNFMAWRGNWRCSASGV